MFEMFDNGIFANVGRKVQIFAMILFVVNVITSIILICVLQNPAALIILVYALISPFPIYAFGQLVDDIHQTRENTSNIISVDELPDL